MPEPRVLTTDLVQTEPFKAQVSEITSLVDDTIAGQFLNSQDQRDVKAFTISMLIAEYVRDYPDRALTFKILADRSFTPDFLEN